MRKRDSNSTEKKRKRRLKNRHIALIAALVPLVVALVGLAEESGTGGDSVQVEGEVQANPPVNSSIQTDPPSPVEVDVTVTQTLVEDDGGVITDVVDEVGDAVGDVVGGTVKVARRGVKRIGSGVSSGVKKLKRWKPW